MNIKLIKKEGKCISNKLYTEKKENIKLEF